LYHASPRIPGLVKYLPEFGWDGIVLTVPIGENPEASFGPPNDFKSKYTVIETQGYQPNVDIGQQAQLRLNLTSRKSYRYARPLLRPLYRLYQEICHYPDKEKRWKTPALQAAEEFLANEKVDAIISSSSPVTCHIIAKDLKNKHRIPWIADLRDLWTQNHAYPFSQFRKMIERRLELATLRHADALVTVTPVWKEKLRELHKAERIFTITNGFDPKRLNEKEVDLPSKFTITYTGQIYTGRQDPSKLLVALQDLTRDRTMNPAEVEVRFYGPEDELLARAIEEYGLSAIVKQYGIVAREVAFKKQRESHLLLILYWENPRERGWYPLKIFEYLAAQRTILSTGGFGNDVVETLLKETKAGVYCRTVEDIKSTLKVLYSEYKSNGKVAYKGKIEEVSKYSYREMARKFATILDQVLADKPS
jgi:hypothetical protein